MNGLEDFGNLKLDASINADIFMQYFKKCWSMVFPEEVSIRFDNDEQEYWAFIPGFNNNQAYRIRPVGALTCFEAFDIIARDYAERSGGVYNGRPY